MSSSLRSCRPDKCVFNSQYPPLLHVNVDQIHTLHARRRRHASLNDELHDLFLPWLVLQTQKVKIMAPETPQSLYPPDLPQSGWTTEGPWCAALQIQKKEFLLLLKRYRVPHIPFGRSVLIDVSRFYQHMSELVDDQTTKQTNSRVHIDPQIANRRHESSAAEAAFATLTKRQVAEILQCSTRQVELLGQKGRLPSPVYLGDSSPRWRRSEIEAIFDHARLSERSSDTPPPSTQSPAS
jgi:predicted DNA-binding transcriptional regulator AlpA